ncbi:MAG: EthD family reductase [Proteobacteria bacterium]|nr:EthD family reductase [Pseudomonadota bacterium]
MKKLIALYTTPKDVDAFFMHYNEIHLPLVEKLPGLLKAEVTKIERTLAGVQGNFLLAEMYFADDASFKTALKSAENAAVGADVMAFAPGLVTVMTGEVLED